MVDLNVGKVTNSITADKLVLSVHYVQVPFDQLFSLFLHFISLASELGRLTAIRDAADHLPLRALNWLVLNVVHLQEL